MNSKAGALSMLTTILALIVSVASGANLKLREAVATVAVSASPEGPGQIVTHETAVTPGQFLKTGADSRAEIVADKGVLRLGSQTTIHVLEQSGEIRLEQGTALFDGLTKQTQLSVRIDNEPIVIEGGVGFAMVSRKDESKPATLQVGNLAGRTVVRYGGDSLVLAPAQVLSLAAGGETRVGAFNLARQLESSTLVHGFKSPLPGRKNIERETARFASLQRRGFVQPENLRKAVPADETLRESAEDRSGSGAAGQMSGIGLSVQASASSQFSVVAGEFGFQSRTAIIAAVSTNPKGNNGIGNGQDPPPPPWQNPHNPHFGQPQNDPPGPGNPGRGPIRRN